MAALVENQAVPAVEQTESIEGRLIRSVLSRLGRPKDLARVVVKALWGSNYRVNVYRRLPDEGPIPRVEMTDSFFLTESPEGLVTRPEIERKY